MANSKISALTSLTGSGAASDDLLAIVDVSANTTKKITREEFLSSVDKISFDLVNGDPSPTEGELTWDAAEKTLSLGLNGGDVVLQVGQEIHYRVRNNTGTTIPDGTVVYASGSVGASGIIRVAPFIADGSIDSHLVLGITTEEITNGADGLVTHFGKVRGINTSAYAEGTKLYASPTVSGGMTTTRPEAPSNVVFVAFVISSANQGTVAVRPRVEEHWTAAPASATASGRKGDVAFDSGYLYVCVATNTWKRVAITAW